MKSKTSLRDNVSREEIFRFLRKTKKRSRYKLKILFDFSMIPIMLLAVFEFFRESVCPFIHNKIEGDIS